MISYPLFERLDVDGYGMFPGARDAPGLHIDFKPGLTVVLGANGLGKTTLVTLLYRMCTGAYEIPGLSGAPILGTRSLTATRLPRSDQMVLASRVMDNAVNATATLRMSVGTDEVVVKRRLDSLAVVALVVNGVELQSSDAAFQDIVTRASGLPAFGDWILILRYLVFYFEDRRALVWDPSAQRQILRLLLLPRPTAIRWADKERDVLELDSRVRNLQATLNREEVSESRARAQAKDSAATLKELASLERALEADTTALSAVSEQLTDAEANRQNARLKALMAEQAHDEAYGKLEHLQLRRIARAFPDHSDTARYLIGQLISGKVCLTCGSGAPDLADEFERRIASNRCVVCNSEIRRATDSKKLDRDIATATRRLTRLDAAFNAAGTARTEADAAFERLLNEFQVLEARIASRRSRIAQLVRKLPQSERSIRTQSLEVSSLRGRLEGLKVTLDARRREFEQQVRRDMRVIAKHSETIIDVFEGFARGFLLEDSALVWAPHKSRVGQTGPLVDFPAFDFQMSGSDFPSPVRRTGPDQVSESQREFVDLAFRMTLMTVTSETRAGSLVIDAPESSLDAVFSERAADVLARFGEPTSQNRLFVTSNLVDGQLIPHMMEDAGIRSASDDRVIDLLALATPTAAIRTLAAEYRRARDRVFDQRARA